MTSIEIGKTYRIAIRGGLDVDVVGSGTTNYLASIGAGNYTGPFFVGITRNDNGDWPAYYKPDGTRLWDGATYDPDHGRYNLLIPRKYILREEALSLLRERHQLYVTEGATGSGAIMEAIRDLKSLTTQEFTDASS